MKTGLTILAVLGWTLTAQAAATGSITGTVDKAAAVTRVVALNRDTWQAFTGRCDAATGAFAIEGLTLGSNYDCRIDFDGASLEGVDLKVPRPEDPDSVLTSNDVADIRAKVLDMNRFDDIVDVLTITGNGEHAAILLNKVRTKPFWNSKPGEVIWRIDLWHYQRPDETWLKVQDELFIIFYRERLSSMDLYQKKSITFDPALGGLRPTAEAPAVSVGRVALPAPQPGIRLRAAGGNQGAEGK